MTQETAQPPRVRGTAQTNDPAEWHVPFLHRALTRPYALSSSPAEKSPTCGASITIVKWADVTTAPVVYTTLFSTSWEQVVIKDSIICTNLPGESALSYLGPCEQQHTFVPLLPWIRWVREQSGQPQLTPSGTEHQKEEKEDARIASFLEQVYAQAESNQVRRAAAKIMEYTDDLLLNGRFDVCGRLLGNVNISRLSKYPTLLVAFLGITLGAKNKLGWSREGFYSSVKVALGRKLTEDRAERILRQFQ